MRRRHAVIALIVLFTLSIVAGCGQGHVSTAAPRASVDHADLRQPSGDGRFQTAAQVRAALPAALEAFGGRFPNDNQANVLARLQRTFDQRRRNAAEGESMLQGPISYEQGAAETVVLDMWMCDWEGIYVAAAKRDDSLALQRADTQLATWYDLKYAKRWVDDPERLWEKQVLTPARAGNTRHMEVEAEECSQAVKP
jgi:hypothetical protein